MLRAIVLMLGSLLLLSCTQKLICPAYQSAFIYDQEALRKKFSYFKEDSTPKILTVSKNKYLIIPETSYRKKIRSMKTVEMKPVYTQLPDSLKPDYARKDETVKGAETGGADSTATDTTAQVKPAADSVYAITKDKEIRVLKYNRDSAKYHIEHITLNADQDNYMWYNRDVLVLPDVRAALQDQKKAKEEAGKAPAKKKTGFLGFFKNLFKKKPKADTTKVVAPSTPPVDSDDPADSTAALEPAEVKVAPPAKKKGFFSFLKGGKKKPKADKKEPEPVVTDPAKKEEAPKDPAKKEGDGF